MRIAVILGSIREGRKSDRVLKYKLHIPYVEQVFDEEGGLLDLKFEKRSDRFLEEFLWLTEAISNRRNQPDE